VISTGVRAPESVLNKPEITPTSISHHLRDTTEFDLSGKSFGRLDWLVGAFASWDKGSGNQTSIDIPALNGVDKFSNYDATRVSNKSWAVFTQNDIHLSDQVYLTLGARYTDETQKQDIGIYTTTPGASPQFQCGEPPNAFTNNPTVDCNVPGKLQSSGTTYTNGLNR